MTMSKFRWPMMLGAVCALLSTQSLQAWGCDCDCEYDTGLSTNSWVKKFKISGDIQGRYQHDDWDNSSEYPSRDRLRIRARLGTNVDLCEWAQAEIRIATGSERANTTHQTFEECFGKKNWNLDRAFVTLWYPDCDWLKFHFGKMKNQAWAPDFLSQLVWDRDVTPEGFAATFDWDLEDDCWSLFGMASYYQVDELMESKNDPWMMDFMLGASFNFDCIKGVLAAGFYFTEHFTNVDCDFADGVYSDSDSSYTMGDFSVLRILGELSYDLCDDCVLGTPGVITVAAGWAHNFDDDYDFSPKELTGYTAQVKFGKAKNPMTWEAALQYKRSEANSTIDNFAESHWHNNGGTDAKGWVVAGKMAVCSWWTVGVKAFFTKKILNTNDHSYENEQPGNNKRFTRVQVDSTWMF